MPLDLWKRGQSGDSVRGVDSVLVNIYFSVLGKFHGRELVMYMYMYSGLDWWLSTCGNAGKDFLFVDRYLKLDV